jgi:polysaccharide biosynthesis/export protein
MAVGVVAMSGTWGSADDSTRSRPDDVVARSASMPAPYRVQVNDVVEFAFFNVPELNQARTVGPDGEVSLQLIGGVRVVGRTVAEVTREVTDRYARELVDPQVTVAVKEFSGLHVYVGGEVNQPGMQRYRGELTALQAVLAAGGFKTTARLKNVILVRKGPDARPVGLRMDLSRVLKHGELDRDIVLAPSDIVFVPRSAVANLNLFVEQYFRNNLPIPVFLGFNALQ